MREEKVTLIPYLEHTQPARFDPAGIELVAVEGYYYDYLAHKDHLALVQDLAGRFFGSPVRVVVTARKEASPSAAGSDERNAPSRAQQTASALAHPVVRAAVDILGGELHEVKTRPRGQRGDT